MAAALAGDEAPTAVFACSDQLALGVLRAARAAGLRVPEELSVVGFDDSAAARFADPPLTTVHQPLQDRGREVGVLVRALLRGETPAVPVTAPVHLVVRTSTAPVGAGRGRTLRWRNAGVPHQ